MIFPRFKNLIIILFILFSISNILLADRIQNQSLPQLFDVTDVKIQGDSTLMGMRIESSYFDKTAFLIETTGARFEYAKGILKLYQGLDAIKRRLLAEIEFDNDPNFVNVESTPDHILFVSSDINIGIYGDSTLIISPKKKQTLICTGHFKPVYEGRYKGELLLIDKKGGMEIYPQRYESGYKIRQIELDKADWIVKYALDMDQRVMIAAFPGRPFDWEESFRCNMLFTYGGRGMGKGNPYGQMPPDQAVKKWAQQGFNILTVSFEGVYKDIPRFPSPTPSIPYVVDNVSEFRRVVQAAHRYGLRFSVYASFYYHYKKFRDSELYFSQIKKLKQDFGIDGIYLDGMLSEDHRSRLDDKIKNWEMIRRLRQLFGPEGSIIYHATNRGSEVATVPNIDTYCTATLVGEIDHWEGPRSKYVQYHVRKYGISNTNAFWLTNHKPANFSYDNVISAVLSMNARLWAAGGVDVLTPPKTASGKYEWSTLPNPGYQKYLDRLAEVKRIYYKNNSGLNKRVK